MRVDAGTSIALFAQAREDFHEQTAMETVISFLQTYGRPHQITFDHDPRWVGSVSGRDFPSPLRRLLLCLGITPHVCPPHRPDKNAYVERYHRTYGQECLQIHRPSTLQEVREVTEAFLQHYNHERPHQGRACGNVPPRVAFPTLPTLPALPERVDPDAWLAALDQKMYLRHVGRDGCVDVDLVTYSIGLPMAGRAVLLQVVAQSRQFAVWHQDQIVKRLPIKGLVGQEMALDEYLQYIQQEALAALRRASVRGGRQNPTAVSLGGRSLSGSCIRRRSQLLASHSGKCGKPFVSCQAQVPGNQKQAVAWSALLSDFPLLFLTRFCFALSRLSFSLFNLSQFDEPTQPEVTMTESHTFGATAV